MSLEPIHHLNLIKAMLKSGSLSYDQALELAQPHLDAMNEKMREMSKEHKMPFKAISFVGFMR